MYVGFAMVAADEMNRNYLIFIVCFPGFLLTGQITLVSGLLFFGWLFPCKYLSPQVIK